MEHVIKKRKIDEKDNEIRKRKIDDVNQINKKMKLLSLETSLNDFKEKYTEFVYDLCNGLNLRKINMNSFDDYLLKNFNLGNAYYVLNNSKYLSKYKNEVDIYNNITVNEEDLWNFFEYELKIN